MRLIATLRPSKHWCTMTTPNKGHAMHRKHRPGSNCFSQTWKHPGGLNLSVYEGNDSQWYWHAKAANGKIVSDSAEGYSSRSSVIYALKRLLKWSSGSILGEAVASALLDLDPAKRS